MRIEWSDEALADLDRFVEFLNHEHPALARRVATEIVSKVQILTEHPQLGRPISGREEYRQIVLQVLRAAYIFQYRIDEGRGSWCCGSIMRANPASKGTANLLPRPALPQKSGARGIQSQQKSRRRRRLFVD